MLTTQGTLLVHLHAALSPHSSPSCLIRWLVAGINRRLTAAQMTTVVAVGADLKTSTATAWCRRTEVIEAVVDGAALAEASVVAVKQVSRARVLI